MLIRIMLLISMLYHIADPDPDPGSQTNAEFADPCGSGYGARSDFKVTKSILTLGNK
jgi:hypothetical protein